MPELSHVHIGDLPNIWSIAIQLLVDSGVAVQTCGPMDFGVNLDGWRLLASSPLELLGLVELASAYGASNLSHWNRWHTSSCFRRQKLRAAPGWSVDFIRDSGEPSRTEWMEVLKRLSAERDHKAGPTFLFAQAFADPATATLVRSGLDYWYAPMDDLFWASDSQFTYWANAPVALLGLHTMVQRMGDRLTSGPPWRSLQLPPWQAMVQRVSREELYPMTPEGLV